jgi:hypothetical protein
MAVTRAKAFMGADSDGFITFKFDVDDKPVW